MLSATNSARPSLADVLPNCLDAVLGRENKLGLSRVDRAVVLLVDGLGASSLAARAGHARTLAGALTAGSTIAAGFPTTTASNLATLTTGEPSGVHGLVGYTVLDAANDRVVNQLSGWDDLIDPATWQRSPTVFERAADVGIGSVVVAPERYRDSGFTRAVLRGAAYRDGRSVADRFEAARLALDGLDRGIVYVYVPELDQTSHARGWESSEWTARLEGVDAVVARFVASLGAGEGLLVTADHGVLDVPPHGQVLFGEEAALVDGIRFVAGEPRCLQLHFEPDASPELRATVIDRWRRAEAGRSDVVSREEAIEAGWFGPRVDQEVVPRIGDMLVAARKAIAYYDARSANQDGRTMIGQHGSRSAEETRVPLLRFGAFAP